MKTNIIVIVCFFCLINNISAQKKTSNNAAPVKANPAVTAAGNTIIKVTATAPGSFVLAGNPSTQTIAPAGLRIFPKWVAGDRDFGFENTIYISSKVTLHISNGGAQLVAKIDATFDEAATARNEEKNRTKAVIHEERIIAYAPTNRRFSKIISDTISSIPQPYWDGNRWDKDYVRPVQTAGPIKTFGINAQTDGNDVGNNTGNDCFLDLDFNIIQVETMDLPAGNKELSLGLHLITDQLRRTLAGTAARINNFGTCANGTCFKDNDCFIKFPDAIMTDTIKFPIADIYSNARHFYFNDVNLQRVACRADGNYLKIDLIFESDGAELVGKCANDLGSYDAGCAFGTPSAQLNNLKIILALRLVSKEGVLTYEALDIQPEISSDFSVDCGILDWLCGEVFKDTYQSSIYNLTTNQIRNTLADPANINKVGQSLTATILNVINALRPGTPLASYIVDVSLQDRNALIRYR